MTHSQFARTAVFVATSLSVAGAHAATLYDAGMLSFESKAQSMWGTGSAFRKAESLFVGAEWSNRQATLGGITGEANTLIFPATPEIVVTAAIPAETTPAVAPKLLTPYVAPKKLTDAIPAVYSPRIPAVYARVCNPFDSRDCWNGGKITDAVPRKLITPQIPATYSPAIPATYSPAIPAITTPAVPAGIIPAAPAVYADTRTGATIDVRSSGKVGLEFGYAIDSGSVDAMARYGVTATLPSNVKLGELFSIKTASSLDKGTITTQSPKVEAYVSQVLQMSGTIGAKVCGLALGCQTSANVALPSVDVNQRLLSIDPNSLKVLDGLMPGGKPFAEVPIANQSLTLEAGLPAGVGFKLTAGPLTVASSWPKDVPTPTTDVAQLSVTVPNIKTSGQAQSAPVTSAGRSDLLSAQLDLDGVAAASGYVPPAGVNFDLIDEGPFKFRASVDLFDANAGPVLGVTQDFTFEPKLMTTIRFSRPVGLGGKTGQHDSWTGEWSKLPEFALDGTTTFSPTFWLDAQLTNELGLDLGLVGTLDVLKIGATAEVGGVELLKINSLSLNSLLGLDNKLFETDKFRFPVYDDTFDLGGFEAIAGRSFTFAMDFAMNGSELSALVGALPSPVPEPSTYAMLLLGLGALGATARRRARQQKDTQDLPRA